MCRLNQKKTRSHLMKCSADRPGGYQTGESHLNLLSSARGSGLGSDLGKP